MIKVKSVHASRLGFVAGLMAAAAMGALGAPGAIAQTKPITVAQPAKPIAVTPPAGAPMSFADLIERVSPAVVSVQVTTEIKAEKRDNAFNPFRGLPGFDEYERDFGNKNDDKDNQETDQDGTALGSGFFISPGGYIVTNNHVVEHAREVTVILKSGDQLEAEIVGTDEQTDLAVLKVKKSGNYPYVEFATAHKPRVGDWVVAVGNPFGLGGTATAGIVSADGRQLDGPYNDFIQVDAPINRGNSGGPTFNLYGEVIGVNTAIFSDTGGGSVGIGFAIEAGVVKQISDTLIKNGKVTRGWLGVEIQPMTERYAEAWGLKNTHGAIVRAVTAGGPAEASGIKRSDIIIAVNDEEVKDSRDLTQRVGSLLAGTKNKFKILRDGKEQTILVTVRVRDEAALAAQTQGDPKRKDMPTPKPSPDDVKVTGATLRPLTPTEASHFDLEAPGTGLMVVTVEHRGAFDKVDIHPGDVILSINNKAVKTVKDFTDATAAAKTAGKKDVIARMGCGDQARCGDATVLKPIEIKSE